MFGMPAYIHSDRGFVSLSQELITFLHECGVACSRTSAYNAPGNGQCERYNGIIWSATKLALKSRNLDIAWWQTVLADALHSVRSLLCRATNETPHERFFDFRRRSTFGISVPIWPSTPGPVYLRRHGRSSKYDTVVEEVELVHELRSMRMFGSVWKRNDHAPAGRRTFWGSSVWIPARC